MSAHTMTRLAGKVITIKNPGRQKWGLLDGTDGQRYYFNFSNCVGRVCLGMVVNFDALSMPTGRRPEAVNVRCAWSHS
jgi:hypothetical protein